MDVPLQSTLLAEGTSDRSLLPIIRLTLAAHVRSSVLLADPVLADDARLSPRIKKQKGSMIESAIAEYPCHFLFVHRDADNSGRVKRLDEIREWVAQAGTLSAEIIPIVPVRMTEAWLLVEELAIRKAAANPNGSVLLGLPPLNVLESLPDPKTIVTSALHLASGLRPGRLKKFDVNKAKGRIAITDLPRLRHLPAFAAFERDVGLACSRGGWSYP